MSDRSAGKSPWFWGLVILFCCFVSIGLYGYINRIDTDAKQDARMDKIAQDAQQPTVDRLNAIVEEMAQTRYDNCLTSNENRAKIRIILNQFVQVTALVPQRNDGSDPINREVLDQTATMISELKDIPCVPPEEALQHTP